MDEARFWNLVQAAHDSSGGDMDRKCDAIGAQIRTLSKENAIAFHQTFTDMMHRAYSYRLWGAAYIINGGCGDDTYSDFCSSLISRGRAAFERALADPDALAEEAINEVSWYYEGYQYAIRKAAEGVAGTPIRSEKPHPAQPSGDRWEEEDLPRLYPKLAARFP